MQKRGLGGVIYFSFGSICLSWFLFENFCVWLGTPKYLIISRKNSRRAMFTARRKRSHCVIENENYEAQLQSANSVPIQTTFIQHMKK